jgi:hypothetical protein
LTLDVQALQQENQPLKNTTTTASISAGTLVELANKDKVALERQLAVTLRRKAWTFICAHREHKTLFSMFPFKDVVFESSDVQDTNDAPFTKAWFESKRKLDNLENFDFSAENYNPLTASSAKTALWKDISVVLNTLNAPKPVCSMYKNSEDPCLVHVFIALCGYTFAHYRIVEDTDVLPNEWSTFATLLLLAPLATGIVNATFTSNDLKVPNFDASLGDMPSFCASQEKCEKDIKELLSEQLRHVRQSQAEEELVKVDLSEYKWHMDAGVVERVDRTVASMFDSAKSLLFGGKTFGKNSSSMWGLIKNAARVAVWFEQSGCWWFTPLFSVFADLVTYDQFFVEVGLNGKKNIVAKWFSAPCEKTDNVNVWYGGEQNNTSGLSFLNELKTLLKLDGLRDIEAADVTASFNSKTPRQPIDID